jgi:alpha-galactosidase/6-phospho-beta-glucosidase family protein
MACVRTLFIFFLAVNVAGCEAFVRKFTRKSKKEKEEQIKMVITPEEYPQPAMTKEEQYRQYFIYWKSWHEELIQSLSIGNTNQKKQLGCVAEAIKNLEELKSILSVQNQGALDVFIAGLDSLRAAIVRDPYAQNANANRQEAERIKRSILRDFSVSRVKGDLS